MLFAIEEEINIFYISYKKDLIIIIIISKN